MTDHVSLTHFFLLGSPEHPAKNWSVHCYSGEGQEAIHIIPELQRAILEACMDDPENIGRKDEFTADDPRNMAPNIASIPPPSSTSDLVKLKVKVRKIQCDFLCRTTAVSH